MLEKWPETKIRGFFSFITYFSRNNYSTFTLLPLNYALVFVDLILYDYLWRPRGHDGWNMYRQFRKIQIDLFKVFIILLIISVQYVSVRTQCRMYVNGAV